MLFHQSKTLSHCRVVSNVRVQDVDYYLYLLPPIALIYGINNADLTVVVFGAAGWSVMAVSIVPTLKLYGLHVAYSVLLPVAGGLYGVMTVSSALRDRRGKSGAWKGRSYSA